MAAVLVPSAAARAAPSRPEPIPLASAARIAIAASDLDAAHEILVVALENEPNSTEAMFLMGQVEGFRRNFDRAAEWYRRILLDQPDLVRVRLELARALFEQQEDYGAEYHFRLVLAAPALPQAVIDNVYRYLTAIKQRRAYTFFVDVGVAPDTNVNAAPAADQVTLFGLPFQLSQQARQKSGVGIVGSANGELLPRIGSGDDRWRLGGSVYRADYPGGSFDDMQARAQTGPQFRFARGDVSLLGVYSQRWFGNEPYNKGYGGRLEFGYGFTPHLRLDGFVEGLRQEYHTQSFLDGYTISGTAFTTYGIDSSSFVRLVTGAGRERTEAPSFSNHSVRLGVGYLRNFAWGITAFLQPEVQFAEYDDTDPAFGTRRRDRVYRVQFSLNERSIQILGFSPVFYYIFTHNDSNIDFYGFERHQFRIGFTREF